MFLLQMSGFPGSGKSTTAQKISQETQAVIIDRDIIKTRLMKSQCDNINELSYNLTYDLVDYYLSLGKSVIIDTPCFHDEILSNGMRLSKNHMVPYKYIECVVESFDTIVHRLSNRDNMISQIEIPPIEVYEKSLDKVVKPSDHLVVNTEKFDLNTVIDYLLGT